MGHFGLVACVCIFLLPLLRADERAPCISTAPLVLSPNGASGLPSTIQCTVPPRGASELTVLVISQAGYSAGSGSGVLSRLHPRSLFGTFFTRQGISGIFGRTHVVLRASYNTPYCDLPVCFSATEPDDGGICPQYGPLWRPICQKYSSSFVPQQWKLWWRGEKLRSSCRDMEADDECLVSLPSAAASCFRIEPAAARPVGDSVLITVAASTEADFSSFQLLAALFLLHIVRPYFSRSKILQLLIASVFGSLILLVLLAFLLFRDLQQSRLGQIGILAAFGAGGIAAVTEGALSAVISFVGRELQHRLSAKIAAAGIACTCAVVTHWYFSKPLAFAVRWALLAAEIVVALCIVLCHPEIAIAGLTTVLLCKLWGIVKAQAEGGGNDEPRDSFPDYVYHGGKFSAPRFSLSPLGRSKAERLRAYSEVGAEFTRSQLESLACEIRNNPSKWAKRVRSPNDLMQWAGTTSGGPDSDEDD